MGRTKEQREKRLEDLQWLHLGFLFFFSGELSRLSFHCRSRADLVSATGRRRVHPHISDLHSI